MLRVRAVLSYYSWLVLSLGLAAEILGLEFLGGRVELIWTLQSPVVAVLFLAGSLWL